MNRKKSRPRSGQDHAAASTESNHIPSIGDLQRQLSDYVACVFEPDDLIEVRRLPSGRSTWHKAADLAQLADELQKDNRAGQNIYVGVNPRKKVGGKKADDVALARVLVADFDGVAPDEALRRWWEKKLPGPTLVIRSGYGTHLYVRLSDPTALDVFTRFQRDLAALLGSDPKIHDPPRILRLPGLLNLKDPAEPVPCCIVEADPASVAELCDLHHLIPHDDRRGANDEAKDASSSDRLNKPSQQTSAYIEFGAMQGNRNSSLFAAACDLAARGWTIQAARDSLAPRATKDGLDIAEVDNTIRSAFSRARTPSSAPPTDSLPKSPGPSWLTLAEIGHSEAYQEGLQPITTGFCALDNAFEGGFRPESVYLLAARTGHAKSTLGLNIARKVALSNEKVLVFKLEESLTEAVWRIHAATAQVRLSVFMDGFRILGCADWLGSDNADLRPKIEDAWQVIRDLPIRMSAWRNIDAIRRISREHVEDGGRLIIVDQLSMVELPDVDSPYERATETSKVFRTLARDLHVPILILAQVNREGSRKDNPVNHPLTVNDLRDSGCLENDAAGVILINTTRELTGRQFGEPARYLQLLVAKNRYGRLFNDTKDPIELLWWPRWYRVEDATTLRAGDAA